MNPLAVNLAAIVVALMTFSVLLGPLLHIPQAVPALLVFGLLGITTLDQFGFQGQGTNIFLDWLAQRSPAYRQRVLHHEAGHFLAAHLLEIPIQGYSLTAWEARRQGFASQAGIAFAEPTVAQPEAAQPGKAIQALPLPLLERYCTVWMAGIAAEKLIYGEVEGGAEDRQKVQFVSGQLGRDGQLQQRQSLLRAEELLKTHRTNYDALVVAMDQRASLEDCQALLAGNPNPGRSK
jgi:hypothetical protein